MADAGGVNARRGNITKIKGRKNDNPSPLKKGRGYSERYVPGPMDVAFFSIVLVLLVIGLIMMFSAGYAWAIKEEGSGTYYVGRQLMYSGIGLGAMFFLSYIDYHFFRNPYIAYGVYGVTVVLLVLTKFSPLGREHNGAQRWIKLPGIPEFQASELAKFAIIIIFAYLISMNHSKLKKFSYGVLPFMTLLGIFAGLIIIQTHLSATILICTIGFVMMFVGGINIKHLVGIGLAAVGLMVIFVIYKANVDGIGYFITRINVWLDPFASDDSSGSLWQTQNSLIAIGSGGLFGMGLGNSRQKFLYLPESKNDFVFAVVCEELGFFGAILVILVFLMFIFRGFYIASKAPDKFGMMIVVGLTVQIGIQALLNIAVVTNAIPNTGISLPFFSYGGTALCTQLAQMGVILNVSRQCVFSPPKAEAIKVEAG